jgi:metallo-beta-lactamase family protein
MKKIRFLGASGEVTGSSFLLTGADDTQLLVDFGMFQGSKDIENLNYEPLTFKPSLLSGVLLTHAHLDHCGRLPLLAFRGFSGKIYMTEPTRALVDVVLNDAAHITQEDQEHEPLYGIDDVDKVLQMIEVVTYDQEVRIGNFSIIFKDAGHILGSASVVITDQTDKKRIVFSGDLGNSPEDIVRPTEPPSEADIVVMESTYGSSRHPKEDVSGIIQREINLVEGGSGVLMIPAFSLERTQEVLHRINHLKKEKKVREDTPVFMDSPMGIRATQIFKDFREFYNDELQSHTDDPFSFPGLVTTEEPRDSKSIIKAMEPKVIIAGSGMLSGGRILHHASNYLGRKSARLLFVGYQAEETLGRKILEGARTVRLYDRTLKVNAHITEIKSLSSHADQPKLLSWLKQINGVKQVFLVHGEEEQREVLADKINQDLGIHDVNLPQNGQELEL